MPPTNPSSSCNISQWIANAIVDNGCTVVYGGHGGALVPLVDAVCAHPKLTWVYARNEHDAATMAAAHAKMTGGLGVVIATSGPGATSLTTGLLEATLDRVPLLAITGMKPTSQLGYAEFQDVNQSRLFAGGGINWSKDVSSADAALPLLRDAVATALTCRTCVHLAIPVDIQAAPSPLPLKHFCASHANLRIQTPVLDETILDATADFLVGPAGQPRPRNIIAVGLRAIVNGGLDFYKDDADAHGRQISKAILDLAEALDAPVLTRLHAKGAVCESHPLSFGVIGVHGKPGIQDAAALISTSDCVVSIGVEDETLLACNLAGLQVRKVVEIEPDAMCVNTRFDAEHTIVGNIMKACQELTCRVTELRATTDDNAHVRRSSQCLDGLSETDITNMWSYMLHGNHPKLQRTVSNQKENNALMDDTDAMWEHIHSKQWKQLLQHKLHGSSSSANLHRYSCTDETSNNRRQYCHPSAVLKALSLARLDQDHVDTASRHAVIAIDVGDVTLWTSLCLSLQAGSRTLYSEHLGTMGYALCAGIAGILARPAPAAAVVLAGDGGFQMSLPELATFQQMKRPGDKLVCIVLDNQVLGRVAFGFDHAGGCDIVGPDYVALAKAYGGDGVLLDDSEHAEPVVRQALAAEGLFVIHVAVDPNVKADMATFQDSSMVVMNSG